VIAVASSVAVLTAVIAAPAEALKFEPVDAKLLPAGVKSALWVRDCGLSGFKDATCAKGEDSFFEGDSVRLARELSAARYDEIWLASGGGNANEGLLVGEVLRRFQATVRVPARQSCVSACTVAFLGGVFRFIDEGATYEVHAASMFLRRSLDEDLMKLLSKDPARELTEWAELLWGGSDTPNGRFRSQRESAHDFFLHLQKALHPLGVLPAGREAATRAVFRNLRQSAPRLTYLTSAQFQEDVARIRREGIPAGQDVLMRLERDFMAQAIEELRTALPSLGTRAEPALRILETMYSSRITGTASLSRQTMVQMGYITELLNLPK
jgi:hypothetical protein